MLNAKQILVSALALVVGMAGLTGCGQTGSLYLPSRPAPVSKPAVPAATPAPAASSPAA
jgi:predicted small lipoprotein YifL